MCNKANLKNRVKQAQAAMNFAKVMQYTPEGKIKTVIVPGHDGKQYHVILRRGKRGKLTTELNLLVNGSLLKTHYTAQITYHCLSVVMLAAQEQGYKVTWTANQEDAERLSNFGGRVFAVSCWENRSNKMYGVMKNV